MEIGADKATFSAGRKVLNWAPRGLSITIANMVCSHKQLSADSALETQQWLWALLAFARMWPGFFSVYPTMHSWIGADATRYFSYLSAALQLWTGLWRAKNDGGGHYKDTKFAMKVMKLMGRIRCQQATNFDAATFASSEASEQWLSCSAYG